MPPTSRAVRVEVDNFLAYLGDAHIAVFTSPVVDDRGRVTWRPRVPGSEFLSTRPSDVPAAYRAWLESGHYSALLFDGALLQITYEFAGRELIGHRLAWVPCPYEIDEELLRVGEPVDIFDWYADGGLKHLVMRAALRFDYDPERAASGHPAAHFSVNAVDCRIACAAPLRLGHFIDFVFRNFYPALWRAHPYLDGLSREAWGFHGVSEEDAQRPHLWWRRT